MGSQNARWSRTGWIYSPELSYSVVVPEGRDLHLGEAKCLDSHPLLLQPFACPGLLGTPLLYSLLQKPVLLLSRISALLLHQLHRAGRRGEKERRREVRQGEQLGSCRLLSQAAPLLWRWMPGASRGTDPATGHCEEATVWIAGDASKHPRVRSDTCLAAGQGAVLSECFPGEVPSTPSRCPGISAWRGVKSLTLLSPVQKREANSHESSPGRQRGWIHLAEAGKEALG